MTSIDLEKNFEELRYSFDIIAATTEASETSDAAEAPIVKYYIERYPATEGDADTWTPGKQEWMILGCLWIVSLMVALDATILVSALPTIAIALNASALPTYWIGTSYLLASAVVQPIIAAFADIFGRRAMLLISVGLFTLGSLIACLAHGVSTMLAGRVVQGVGGGGVIVLTLVIISDIVPLRQRPKYLAFNILAWAGGTVSGPLIGGAFSQNTSWRWIFYLNFPICAIGLGVIPFAMRYHQVRRSFRENLASIDFIGGFFFIAGTVSFLMAISWGGVQFPWKSYQTLVPLLIGLATIVISLLWEVRFAKQPFLRLSIYRNRSAVATLICTLLQGFILYLGLYYLSFFFLSVKRKTPVKTGIAFLPLTISLLTTASITGLLITRLGRFQALIRIGWSFTVLSIGLLILLDMNTKTVVWVIIFVVVGIGQGMTAVSLQISLLASVESRFGPDASALFIFMRSLGMALGVGIGGTAFQNTLSHQLKVAGLPTSISKDAEAFLQYMAQLPPSDHDFVISVLEAYSRSFKNLFEIATAISGVAFLLSFLIRHSDINKALAQKHVLKRDYVENDVSLEEKPR